MRLTTIGASIAVGFAGALTVGLNAAGVGWASVAGWAAWQTPRPLASKNVEEQRTHGREATPAATVVPLRDGAQGVEVLMLRRNNRGAFGGMWVFPGGKIDESDLFEIGVESGSARRPNQAGDDGEIAAARRAAVREALEEASLVLDPYSLVVHSWWLPPADAPRRFATWFFLAPAGDAPEVVVDGAEIHEHRWFTPAGAHAARDRGEVTLAPPTWMTLWWVGQFPDAAGVLEAGAHRPLERFETRMRRIGEDLVSFWQGDVAYESGDAEAPGARRRLWMGSPKWRAEVGVDGPGSL